MRSNHLQIGWILFYQVQPIYLLCMLEKVMDLAQSAGNPRNLLYKIYFKYSFLSFESRLNEFSDRQHLRSIRVSSEVSDVR